MQFEYHGSTRKSVEDIFGNLVEFEDQIRRASARDNVTNVGVHPLNPGLSGAAVFLIRRIGQSGFTPWVLKASTDIKLIVDERDNNETRVRGKLQAAPTLIATGSSKLLIFELGGFLAEYDPQTLRAGYSKSTPSVLSTLMHRIVQSLNPIHSLSEDTASCVDRMPSSSDLKAKLDTLTPQLPSEVADRLLELWNQAFDKKSQFPRRRSTGHGDLNSGNVLFEPGVSDSFPVFIDFASMRKSKDSELYPDYYHLPFWDYAKLERDIQTRLFLKEAIEAQFEEAQIIAVITAVNGSGAPLPLPLPLRSASCVAKLIETAEALRAAVRKKYAPQDFLGLYRIVLARAMITVLFRKLPDTDLPLELQHLTAAKAAITLLEDPVGEINVVNWDQQSIPSSTVATSADDSSQSHGAIDVELSAATDQGKVYVFVKNKGRAVSLRAKVHINEVHGFSQDLSGKTYPISWDRTKGRDLTLYPTEEGALTLSSLVLRNSGDYLWGLHRCGPDGGWENPIDSLPFIDEPPFALVRLDLLTKDDQVSFGLKLTPDAISRWPSSS